MNKLLLSTLLFFTTLVLVAQVGIGTANPDASAVLELSSNNKGFLPPRVADETAIATPATGLIIYNTTKNCLHLNIGNPTVPDWQCIGGTAPVKKCGAYTAKNVFTEFMCHNLGADESLDPHEPVQGIHGNYYQWGSKTVVADASTPRGKISGWNTTKPPRGAWSDTTKTANDPCPNGYRIPTRNQWLGLIATGKNKITEYGSFSDSSTNFGSALHIGPDASTITLTLPVTGFRNSSNGGLMNRGSEAFYWSSTEPDETVFNYLDYGYAYFFRKGFRRVFLPSLIMGISVRCVAE